MSGFLHRIAAQAMDNRDSTLHSIARLPYSIAPSPANHEEPATWTAKANKPRLTDKVPSQNQPPDSKLAEIRTQPFENEAIPASPEVLVTESVTGITLKPELEMTPPSSAESRRRQAKINVRNIVADESPVWDESINIHTRLSHSATQSGINEPLTDSTIPVPLLPLKNTAHSPALSSSAVARRGEPGRSTWQNQVEETTKVHVSIGRIEVTAVHELQPPKRQTPATAKPMTLDEYLARRQRQA